MDLVPSDIDKTTFILAAQIFPIHCKPLYPIAWPHKHSHLICRSRIIDVSQLCPSSRFLNSTNDSIIHSDAQSKHKAKQKPESHGTDFYGPHQTHQQILLVLFPNIFDSPLSLSVLIATTPVHTTILSHKRMGNCLSASFSLLLFNLFSHI